MTDDSDIEYYVKFPTRSAQSSTLTNNSDEDDFVLVHNESSKPPAVILIGWAGCQDKYLAKYSAIYEEKGCITLRCSAPLQLLFLRRGQLRVLGRRLLGAMLDLNLNEHPVFFHVFSNGGAFLYKHIALAIREEAAPVKVVGVTWDSAPGERRLWSLYLALRAILEGRCRSGCPALWLSPVAMTLAVLTTAWWMLDVMVRSLLQLGPVPLDPLAELRALPAICPQLFIYSPADQLIRSEDVERYANHRRAVGEKVSFLRFEDSPHVQHFLLHREEYVGTIMAFMRGILSELSWK